MNDLLELVKKRYKNLTYKKYFLNEGYLYVLFNDESSKTADGDFLVRVNTQTKKFEENSLIGGILDWDLQSKITVNDWKE